MMEDFTRRLAAWSADGIVCYLIAFAFDCVHLTLFTLERKGSDRNNSRLNHVGFKWYSGSVLGDDVGADVAPTAYRFTKILVQSVLPSAFFAVAPSLSHSFDVVA